MRILLACLLTCGPTAARAASDAVTAAFQEIPGLKEFAEQGAKASSRLDRFAFSMVYFPPYSKPDAGWNAACGSG